MDVQDLGGASEHGPRAFFNDQLLVCPSCPYVTFRIMMLFVIENVRRRDQGSDEVQCVD